MRRALGCLAFLLGVVPQTNLSAQVDLGAYALAVGTYAAESDLTPAGSTFLGRARMMASGALARLEVEAAYEHVLTRTPRGGGFAITAPAGAASRSDWLGTDWELHHTPTTEWRHRFDRLNVGYAGERLEVVVGRQAISWATTLLLTPADPFAPFDPADPFREYRGGVDALRVRVFTGPFTELEAVLRPTETAFGTTVTALGRAQTSVAGWALGGWAGLLHDEAAGALFATGALGATAIRTELALRDAPGGDGATARMALGADRFFTPGGKNLALMAELQYDGFGAPNSSKLLDIYGSKPFLRGEMQTLGRWSMASQVSYQLHPLVSLDLTALLNPRDGSGLLAPGLTWSASTYASLRFGFFAGLGDGLDSGGSLGSEYGSVPNVGYASLSWYF